jgi:hypothetical protein
MLLLWRPLKIMLCHSWYLSQELETLSLFSHHLSSEEKAQLMSTMKGDRGLHLVQSLPRTIRKLYISRSFFWTTANSSWLVSSIFYVKSDPKVICIRSHVRLLIIWPVWMTMLNLELLLYRISIQQERRTETVSYTSCWKTQAWLF